VTQLTELATELVQESTTLERELAEIDLLMRQASSEAERHEARRVQAEERMSALDRDPAADPTMLSEARAQLLSQTRRQTLMQGQIEVLQGKQRALQRYYERLSTIVPAIGGTQGATEPAQIGPGSGLGNVAGASSRDVMAAQEQMRREIAREMHDGPAQSIANIALQAQVVERLMTRDPRQAESELRALVTMVQSALEATKTFIFDIRPMVLDDLGLVPTLRRTASERSRRSGVQVGFESIGADTRLGTELESAMFRIVDDALQGMLEARPAELVVSLDWQEAGVTASVRGRGIGAPVGQSDAARMAVAAARRDKQMPGLLASMIHEQETVERRGLSEKTWLEIRDRAEPAGIAATLSPDGWTLEASVSRPR
jgi:two-component system sensor histidine kinase DegS